METLDDQRIAPTPENVRRAIGHFHTCLAAAGVERETLEHVQMVLTEVLNNTVEHAMRDNATGAIDIALKGCSNHVCFQVLDDGEPMPGGRLPDGNPPAVDVPTADLPEGGFGWFMIRSVADELQYTRTDGGNCLFVRIRRQGQGATT